MKKVPATLGTAENESGSAKHENGTQRPRYRRKLVRERRTGKQNPTPSVSPKKGPGADNMKTGFDALGTAENESGRAEHENWTDTRGTTENESGSAKHENWTRRPQYRRKHVR
jgi:hypothetical protein